MISRRLLHRCVTADGVPYEIREYPNCRARISNLLLICLVNGGHGFSPSIQRLGMRRHRPAAKDNCRMERSDFELNFSMYQIYYLDAGYWVEASGCWRVFPYSHMV